MSQEISKLTDDELCCRLHRLAGSERESLVAILYCLIEFDARRLHEKLSMRSAFDYCVKALKYSASAAGKRIYAARTARNCPRMLGMLESGDLHLEGVVMLGPYRRAADFADALDEARGKTVREIQWIIARRYPRPDVRDTVRRDPMVPEGFPGPFELMAKPEQSAPATGSLESSLPPWGYQRRPVVEPLSERRARISFTGGEFLLSLLRRAQDVLRHKYPAGDLEKIFQEALEALLDRKDPERRLRAKEDRREGKDHAARPMSVWAFAARSVPQSVKDAVWRRDGGRCVRLLPNGERCPERGGLEFDHIVPFALGGPSNNPKNIRLLCRAHNLEEARLKLGETALRHQGRLGGGGPAAGLSGPGTSPPPCG